MTINLKANERLDDLQRNGYKLIQNSTVFCFGMDAVLLTAFSTIKDGENMIDLGCGNGVIPILLKGKTKGAHFTGLEIQDINVDMARRSVEYNGIGDCVDIVQGDIREACSIFKKGSFDVVTSNPPYMTQNHWPVPIRRAIRLLQGMSFCARLRMWWLRRQGFSSQADVFIWFTDLSASMRYSAL